MTAATYGPVRIEEATGPDIGVTGRRTIHSEWIKMRSLRSTWFTYTAAAVGMVGISALVCYLTNARWSSRTPAEIAEFDPTARSLVGVHLAQLAIAVLGVLLISGEYATGMIRSTLGAVPRRLPVLWGKLVVFAATTLVLMVVTAFAAFLIGQRLLHSHGISLSAPGAPRAVVGVALYLTAVGVLAVGLGFILRSTAGGIAAFVGLMLVLPAIGRVLPESWRDNIVPYLPSEAGSALFSVRSDPTAMAPWTGFAVLCAWAAAAVLVGAVLLRRRDA